MWKSTLPLTKTYVLSMPISANEQLVASHAINTLYAQGLHVTFNRVHYPVPPTRQLLEPPYSLDLITSQSYYPELVEVQLRMHFQNPAIPPLTRAMHISIDGAVLTQVQSFVADLVHRLEEYMPRNTNNRHWQEQVHQQQEAQRTETTRARTQAAADMGVERAQNLLDADRAISEVLAQAQQVIIPQLLRVWETPESQERMRQYSEYMADVDRSFWYGVDHVNIGTNNWAADPTSQRFQQEGPGAAAEERQRQRDAGAYTIWTSAQGIRDFNAAVEAEVRPRPIASGIDGHEVHYLSQPSEPIRGHRLSQTIYEESGNFQAYLDNHWRVAPKEAKPEAIAEPAWQPELNVPLDTWDWKF